MLDPIVTDLLVNLMVYHYITYLFFSQHVIFSHMSDSFWFYIRVIWWGLRVSTAVTHPCGRAVVPPDPRFRSDLVAAVLEHVLLSYSDWMISENAIPCLSSHILDHGWSMGKPQPKSIYNHISIFICMYIHIIYIYIRIYTYNHIIYLYYSYVFWMDRNRYTNI